MDVAAMIVQPTVSLPSPSDGVVDMAEIRLQNSLYFFLW